MPDAVHPTVLQYTGYSTDRGGTIAVLRTIAGERAFRSIHGAGPGFAWQGNTGEMRIWRGLRVRADEISPVSACQAMRVAVRVRRWLQGDSQRIFHGHSRAGLLVALWLARWGERRVMVTVHYLGRKKWFYRYVHRMLGPRVLWLSPAMKQYYGVGDATWSGCMPDCVRADTVRPPSARGPKSRIVFGCAGAIVPVKNWELVLRGLAQLPASCPVRVRHAGSDNGTAEGRAYASAIRRLADELGLGERIEWLGPLAEMKKFYEGIDCLVVPSKHEAFGAAPVEAVAAGVPVLAADQSGTRDLISACAGGWVFPADSVSGLAAELQRLVEGAELAGWRRDDAGFTRFLSDRVAAQHLQAYRELLRHEAPG